jgi:putative flippase GtrA
VSQRTAGQIFRFVAIGGIGFGVEALVLALLVLWQDWGPYAARFISFPIAVTATWLLNRTFTFGSSQFGRGREYFSYLSVQLVGVIINFSVYYWHVEQYNKLQGNPVFSLFLGSIIAMGFNFVGSKYLVFRGVSSEA